MQTFAEVMCKFILYMWTKISQRMLSTALWNDIVAQGSGKVAETVLQSAIYVVTTCERGPLGVPPRRG